MEAAGLRVRWKVRAGCGFFSSNSTTQVVFPVVWPGHVFPATQLSWLFSEPHSPPSHWFCEHNTLLVHSSKKLSRVCFCSRHCDGLSKIPFKSEEFIFSAVEWAAGRQPSAVSPLQNGLSWRVSLPKVTPALLNQSESRDWSTSGRKTWPLSPTQVGLPEKKHNAQIISDNSETLFQYKYVKSTVWRYLWQKVIHYLSEIQI